ncbi:MAG: DEAD/DEAH box helicase, partial [Planctomycetaceae bacterium]|nr:DEAD/DEAH box helicase [Planctomycetaceae bacterium]
MDALGFHPLIERWFAGRFAGPTEPQRRGWPAIAAGEHTLIAAPTGSGKTLTAFLAVIDRLVRESLETPLPDEIRVVYVSPLRALSNDMQRNLQQPLGEMVSLAELMGIPFPALRVGLRTGDTTASARAALLRKPPHILVTTPESLYLLLTTTKGRERLRNVDTVIVDEIHALLRDKRGSHLSLSLERLAKLSMRPIQRIGLSATQKPLELVANFLIGAPPDNTLPELHQCTIVDVGHQRQLDLAIEVPFAGLGAVCTHEQWAIVHQRIVELIEEHRSTLIFVNTRRMAERLTHQLSTLLGEDQVSSHHGSLSTEMRLKTEQRLKNGEIKAVVATASLELGIDIGYIDLVVQIGSPRSIAAFLQRTGRAGHSLHAIPKSRLFALTRDELGECAALIRAVRSGILDTLRVPVAPLDILVQQIVAETTADEASSEDLLSMVRRAYPYRNLTREAWDEALKMCSEGFTENAGRTRSLLYHDRIGQRVKARPAAKLAAIGNAGAIPETGQYRVVALPENTVIGSVDEDFAVESSRGDIFLLGNTSWRIEFVRGGDVAVSDAHNAPPSIPFWFGEAPGRTLELSEEISRLRDDLVARLDDASAAAEWLAAEATINPLVAEEFVEYVRSQQAAIGLVPTQQRVVFERFFDESGGMQLVIHAPFGSAINRAWGYALRKRFCRSFDFELQATADDDGVILSLGPQHSFSLESLFGMLTSENVQSLLEQAILVQPPFQLRWRWNVTRSLFVMRQKFGKKVPPALQRFRSEDLLTSVFPQLTGCLENHTGDIELPDHPLVKQTMHDCLHEALDLDGLITVLRRIESGDIKLIPRDTREPSPFCFELLNAYPYAFLDGGEIQERRTRVVESGSVLTAETPDLTWLDPAAMQQVVQEATPLVRNRDELHDLLLGVIIWPIGAALASTACLADPPNADWRAWFDELVTERRAWSVTLPEG